MATRRDLVEAQAFSRRRLVTAFVSGAPGGREVEAARPGRTIVGGAVLAVLLLAGGVAGSVLAGRTAVDWDHPRLVISQELGQPYVITHRGLHPVVNITSARLVLGSSVEPGSRVVDEPGTGRDRRPAARHRDRAGVRVKGLGARPPAARR